MAQKRDIFLEIRNNGDPRTRALLKEAIEVEINELRVMNDAEESESEIRKNQGGIAALRRLTGYLA